MKNLVKFLKPYRKECILGPFCKWMEALLELLMPTVMAVIINEGVMHHNKDIVIPLGIGMVLMVVVGFLFPLLVNIKLLKLLRALERM